MFAVIFEVYPKPDRRAEYLEIANALRSDLETIDGFISIERFTSFVDEDKMLSLSFWRDEAAIADWRNRINHQKAQAKARQEIFIDYRLRVAEVMRDYSMTERDEAPQEPPENSAQPN
jgi:heme-degrading monooxygenase HmoA